MKNLIYCYCFFILSALMSTSTTLSAQKHLPTVRRIANMVYRDSLGEALAISRIWQDIAPTRRDPSNLLAWADVMRLRALVFLQLEQSDSAAYCIDIAEKTLQLHKYGEHPVAITLAHLKIKMFSLQGYVGHELVHGVLQRLVIFG